MENEKHDLKRLRAMLEDLEHHIHSMQHAETSSVIEDRLHEYTDDQSLVELMDEVFNPIYSEIDNRLSELD